MSDAELVKQLRRAKPLAELLINTKFTLPLSAPENELLIGLADELDSARMIEPWLLKEAGITPIELTALSARLTIHLKRSEEQLSELDFNHVGIN